MDINNKIIAKEWWLKPSLNAISLYCYNTKTRYTDYKEVDRTVRVVGTKNQILELFKKLLIEEGLQLRGTYDIETTDLHLKLYKENNKQALIIN